MVGPNGVESERAQQMEGIVERKKITRFGMWTLPGSKVFERKPEGIPRKSVSLFFKSHYPVGIADLLFAKLGF